MRPPAGRPASLLAWALAALLLCAWSASAPAGSLTLAEQEDGSTVFLDPDGNVVGFLSAAEDASGGLVLPPPQQLPGWPLDVGEVQSTPTVADVDGDGRLDVVFATLSTPAPFTYVVDVGATPLPGWPVETGRSGNTASVADILGDARPEILSGTGQLFAIDAAGNVLPGWPAADAGGFAVVAVEDLDRDGLPEIAGSDQRGKAFLFDAAAVPKPGWPFDFNQPFGFANKGPAVGDTDGDGVAEIAFPMRIRPSLYLFSPDGSVRPGFPLDFQFGVGPGVTMADLDGDGAHELIFQESARAHVIDGTGARLPGWPVFVQSGNSVSATGDIDGDGRLEFVWATIGGDAAVYAYNDDGTPVEGWPVIVPNFSFNGQPTLGDVDGDGGVDVVIGGFVASFSSDGRVYAWHADGTRVERFPFLVPEGKAVLSSSVTLTDLDQDGDVDLLVGTVTGIGGTEDGRLFAFDLEAPYDPFTMEWPTKGHDVRNTSRYEPLPRKQPMGLALEPEVIDPGHPPAVVTARLDLPPGFQDASLSFHTARVGFLYRRPLPGADRGSGTDGRRVVQFDGGELAALLRDAPGAAGGRVSVEVQSGPLDGLVLTGFATVRTAAGPPPPEPEIRVSPAALDLGEVPFGLTGAGEVRVENLGQADLELRDLRVQGDGFSTTTPISLTLPAGGAVSVPVVFSPPAEGAFSGSLGLVSNDDDESRAGVPLQAVGGPAAPEIKASPAELLFGESPLGTSETLELTLENGGIVELLIDEIRSDDASFEPSTGQLTVGPGAAASLSVTFAPPAAGERSAVLRLRSNDPRTPELAVPLAGSGAATLFASLAESDRLLGIGPDGAGFPLGPAPAGVVDLDVAADGTLRAVSLNEGTLLRVDLDGTTTEIAGAAQGISLPTAIGFDAAGTLLVASVGTGEVLAVDGDGVVSRWAALPAGAVFPAGLALLPTGEIAVCDSGAPRIAALSADGGERTFAEAPGLTDARGCASGPGGELYVAYGGGSGFGPSVLRFAADGTFSVFVGAADGLQDPWDLLVDAAGRLYVADRAGESVLRFDSGGAGGIFADLGPDRPFGLALIE